LRTRRIRSALSIERLFIADRQQVHKRCKDAPSNYDDLATRVLRLREVLDDQESFLRQADNDGHIPQSKLRLASLRAMRGACNTDLDEVDNFLEKYSDVVSEQGKRRVISRWKFIVSDADALKKKLEYDASSLQLSLTSLTK
jgi:hypothetical protein